jgi:hypothetical protein
VDSSGKYVLPASAGQYRVCVYGADPYLDPCQWGGSVTLAVASAVVSTPLSSQFAGFTVRVWEG